MVVVVVLRLIALTVVRVVVVLLFVEVLDVVPAFVVVFVDLTGSSLLYLKVQELSDSFDPSVAVIL